MHPFRSAIEARDVDAVVALLSDDVVLRSPVAFKPYRGRAAVAALAEAESGRPRQIPAARAFPPVLRSGHRVSSVLLGGRRDRRPAARLETCQPELGLNDRPLVVDLKAPFEDQHRRCRLMIQT